MQSQTLSAQGHIEAFYTSMSYMSMSLIETTVRLDREDELAASSPECHSMKGMKGIHIPKL
jgi:hypothetical protein